jgi:hypothetical protein
MVAPTDAYAYMMPDSSEEIGRLPNKQDWVKSITADRLLFAPIEQKSAPVKVLDSANADGAWQQILD